MNIVIAVALYRLAAAHGHEWANHVTEEDILALGWDAATAQANKAIDAIEHTLMCAIRPSVTHTTGTGRLSWVAYPECLSLTVSRRSAIGGVTVATADLRPQEGGFWQRMGQIDARPEIGAELRHLETLECACMVAMGEQIAGCEGADSYADYAIARVDMHCLRNDGSAWDADSYIGGSPEELLARITEEQVYDRCEEWLYDKRREELYAEFLRGEEIRRETAVPTTVEG